MFQQENAAAGDLMLKSKRLVLDFSIKKHTSPASKVLIVEEKELMELRCEGQTAAADAIDAGCTWSTATDSTGVFGLLLHDINFVSHVKTVEVTADAGTVAATAGISADGNIFINCDSNQDLSADTTTTINFIVAIDYKLKK